jgi:hypothetical protein
MRVVDKIFRDTLNSLLLSLEDKSAVRRVYPANSGVIMTVHFDHRMSGKEVSPEHNKRLRVIMW